MLNPLGRPLVEAVVEVEVDPQPVELVVEEVQVVVREQLEQLEQLVLQAQLERRDQTVVLSER
jgi:hypothetical protein